MRKPSHIRLGLVTTAAALLTGACGPDAPARGAQTEIASVQPELRGYRNPADTTQVSSTPRAGWVPYFYPLYLGGGSYYDASGRYHATGAPQALVRSAPARGTAPSTGARTATARGGFGSTATAAGRSAST